MDTTTTYVILCVIWIPVISAAAGILFSDS